MTITELKTLAQRTLDFGIRTIRESGELTQQFTLVQRDGTLVMMAIDGRITNSEKEKEVLGKTLHARVATGDIEAVIMLSDTWTAEISPENARIKDKLRMNVVEAAAFGLCEKFESVVVTLESPILCQTMWQKYSRNGGDITPLGDPVIRDNTTDTYEMMPARFSGFFHAQRQGSQRPS